MSNTYYDVAANWWTTKIQSDDPHKFDNGDRQDNGMFSNSSLMIMLMAAKLSCSAAVPREVYEKFRETLAREIKAQLEENPERTITLRVDYGPEGLLATCAESTGVPGERFPYKTTMWVSTHKVEVSDGYAAEPKTIWSDKD